MPNLWWSLWSSKLSAASLWWLYHSEGWEWLWSMPRLLSAATMCSPSMRQSNTYYFGEWMSRMSTLSAMPKSHRVLYSLLRQSNHTKRWSKRMWALSWMSDGTVPYAFLSATWLRWSHHPRWWKRLRRMSCLLSGSIVSARSMRQSNIYYFGEWMSWMSTLSAMPKSGWVLASLLRQSNHTKR